MSGLHSEGAAIGSGAAGRWARRPRRPRRDWSPRPAGEPPLADLEFPGCVSRPMTVAEHEESEERIEFFDTRAGIAWMAAEAAFFPHEEPVHALPRLLERIAQVRGSAIRCWGAGEIRRRFRAVGGRAGWSRRIQPDQMVFLDPGQRERIVSGYLKAGEDPFPDVVLEVDSTTDVRRNRLKLYEAWGFPEVWVEVPVAYSPGRRRRSGLTIYRWEEDGYVVSTESRAFPGWRGGEIHRALNERAVSAETSEVLTRVGRALGKREGTGPDDDPLLRQQRREGLALGRLGMAAVLLRRRGVALSPDFPTGLSARHLDLLAAASAESLIESASAAESEADFLSRLSRHSS